jgi:hypothetical protein
MGELFTLKTFSLDPKVKQFTNSPIQLRPFLIQGATTGIPPGNPTRTSTVYEQVANTKGNFTPLYSTTPSNYASSQVNTKNIILSDYCPGTTLVDMVDTASTRYDFCFAAIHKNDLNTESGKDKVEDVLSIVFIHKVDIYHIQIPLIVSSSMQPSDMNPLLRAWFNTPNVTTNQSYSINQLCTFKQSPTVEMDRFVFKMTYNQSSTSSLAQTTNIKSFIGKYTLCIFNTPQYVIDGTMFTNDLKTYSDVFNLIMYDTMGLANPRYPLVRSSDVYFMANSPTKYPSATFYRVPSQYITQINLNVKEGFSSGTGRLLNSVKCYPIDLATQVDNNGDIYIDEKTSKPIDVRQTYNSISDGNSTLPLDSTSVPSNYNYRNLFIALFVVVLLSLGSLIVVYFIFRSSPPAPAPAAPAPAAAAASLNEATNSPGNSTLHPKPTVLKARR